MLLTAPDGTDLRDSLTRKQKRPVSESHYFQMLHSVCTKLATMPPLYLVPPPAGQGRRVA